MKSEPSGGGGTPEGSGRCSGRAQRRGSVVDRPGKPCRAQVRFPTPLHQPIERGVCCLHSSRTHGGDSIEASMARSGVQCRRVPCTLQYSSLLASTPELSQSKKTVLKIHPEPARPGSVRWPTLPGAHQACMHITRPCDRLNHNVKTFMSSPNCCRSSSICDRCHCGL
jgi:hypothetical protein